ncbi:hypothetical protein BCY91_14045 [Pelobium manganitolerans]|uniref:ATPase n=1 Tax=Pelobium manganitolerans TaxID=1842495 RepID=A0A419SAB3_9SPHI|nr:hypothetical protein [Pelobium manganitolerans]RKD18994.1 hypothetical protein BCY91_14045 [Pelobium manganitolerans]
MEKTIKDLLQSQVAISESYKPEWEDVELSEDELNEVIKSAKIKKLAEIRLREHAEKVNRMVEVPNYTPEQLGKIILKTAREQNPDFVIDDGNRAVFKLLCQYFTLDPAFEKTAEAFSLRKGIMIVGPVGCGKTTMLSFFRKNTVNSFRVLSCRDVAGEYTEMKDGGNDVLQYYSGLFSVPRGQFYNQADIGAFFDDLGTESVKKHFGNEVNVMQEVILNRYDRGIRNKTHFTTNLNAEAIGEYYGARVRSRLREMCNIITFPDHSPDRRS